MLQGFSIFPPAYKSAQMYCACIMWISHFLFKHHSFPSQDVSNFQINASNVWVLFPVSLFIWLAVTEFAGPQQYKLNWTKTTGNTESVKSESSVSYLQEMNHLLFAQKVVWPQKPLTYSQKYTLQISQLCFSRWSINAHQKGHKLHSFVILQKSSKRFFLLRQNISSSFSASEHPRALVLSNSIISHISAQSGLQDLGRTEEDALSLMTAAHKSI